MTAKSLILINPNSNETVTAGIDRAMEPLRPLGVPIRCVTLAEGPPGIESQRDADRVVPPLLELVARLEPESLGFGIACFSDPGLHSVREATALPVVGIMEAGIGAALTMGDRYGIIAILETSIPRHLRAIRAMGQETRLAGDRALGLRVAELADEGRTLGAMIDTGRALKADGADVLVMGCAGMARYRDRLEQETGLPVVEPCQAAATLLIGRTLLGWRHRRYLNAR